MVLFFLLDEGYMNMYSCELINLAQRLVKGGNFTQQNDRAFVKRLVWLLSFIEITNADSFDLYRCCLLYTSPSPRDRTRSRMPSSA